MSSRLFRAIEATDPSQVIAAISRGANVDAVDKNNTSTPLLLAIDGAQPTIIRALLRAGADVDKQVGGFNALAAVLMREDDAFDRETFALLLAAGADANSIVCDAVVDSDVDVPILALAVNAHKEAVPLLLAAGAAWETDLAGEFVDDDEIEDLVAMVCNPYAAKKEIELVGFGCCRERALEVCIALQSLGLPVPVLVGVVVHACEPFTMHLPLHYALDVTTTVAHFRSHVQVPVRRARDLIDAAQAERDRRLHDFKAMLTAKQNAAKEHAKKGEVVAAKAAYEFVLDAHSRALGEEHEWTLSIKKSLALLNKLKRR